MNDPNPQPQVETRGEAAEHPPPPPRKRRRLRRALRVFAIVLAALLLLTIFTPNIASTGPGRRLALALINHKLAGRADVDDWSLSWLHPQRLDGVRIVGGQGTVLLSADHLESSAGLLDLLRGSPGDARVDIQSLRLDLRPSAGKAAASQPAGARRPAKERPTRDLIRFLPRQAVLNIGKLSGTLVTADAASDLAFEAGVNGAMQRAAAASGPGGDSLDLALRLTNVVVASQCASDNQGASDIKGGTPKLPFAWGCSTGPESPPSKQPLGGGTPTGAGEQQPLKERELVVQLKLVGRPGGSSYLVERADIDATGSRLLVLHSAGQWDDAGDGRLELCGDCRLASETLRMALGRHWPAGLEVEAADVAHPFSLSMPLRDLADRRVRLADLLKRRARFDCTATWAEVRYQGLRVGPPASPVPVALADGLVAVGPAVAPANGGTLNICGQIDLAGPVAWLRLPPGGPPLRLLDSVRINEDMSNRLIKAMHPIFPDARKVSGLMDLTVREANMPLDRKTVERAGRLAGAFRVRDLRIAGGLLEEIAAAVEGGAEKAERSASLLDVEQPIDFRDGRFYLKDSTVEYGANRLTFNGWASLMDEREAKRLRKDTLKMTVTLHLGQATVDRLAKDYPIIGRDVRRLLPQVPIVIPLRGSLHHYKLDAGEFAKALGKAVEKALRLQAFGPAKPGPAAE